jgi:hypothetical protein
MSLHRRPAVTLLVVVVLLGAACGSGSDQLTREALEAEYGGAVVLEGDAFTVTDDTGSMRVAPEIPAGLEAPVLNRWTTVAAVVRSGDGRPTRLVELTYPPDRFDDIIIFYEAWAASREVPIGATTSGDYLTTTWVADDAGGTVIEVTLDPIAITVKIAEGL